MRTIAIINQKGGCGKTTCSINLAAVLAQGGHRTLLVDVDPQSHCAQGLAVPDAQIELSIGNLLRAGLDGSVDIASVRWQVARRLDLIPSSMGLATLEQELAQAPDRDRRLQQLLATVTDQYEFCIIDCPPSIGLLTFNALRAAGEVIIPVETGYFALQGSFKQEATIQMLARRANHHARFNVLATMYDVRTRLAREILTELRKHFGEQLLPVVVHFNSKLKEAASFGQPITEYDPGSRGSQDFDRLASWILENPPAPAPSADRASEAGASGHPALSRAAELVERARALAARTQTLTARIDRDSDFREAIGAGRPARESPNAPTAPSSSEAIEAADFAAAVDPASRRPETAAPAHDGEAEPDAQMPGGHAVLQPVDPANHTDKRSDREDAALAKKLERLYGVKQTAQGLLFVQPTRGARQIAVAGDFNDWRPEQTPMSRDEQTGVWKTIIPVVPGRYRYRLVVDGQWVQDPYNPYVESNPFGELNNVVEAE